MKKIKTLQKYEWQFLSGWIKGKFSNGKWVKVYKNKAVNTPKTIKSKNIWTGVSKVKKKTKSLTLRDGAFDKRVKKAEEKEKRLKKIKLFRKSGMTLDAIGKKMGVSKARIDQILNPKKYAFVKKADFK